MHAAVLHIDAQGNETWIPIEGPADAVPGTVSANSIHQGTVIGVYKSSIDGQIHGFVVTIPGIYNPIRNSGLLDVNTPRRASDRRRLIGDDVVNDGTVRTTGANNSGIQSDTYGIVYNNGIVEVTGRRQRRDRDARQVRLAVKRRRSFTPRRAPMRSGPMARQNAEGTVVVNYGVIDGRIAVKAGPWARFENSGLIGISAPGAGTTHEISGVFAQTSAGTWSCASLGDSSDMLACRRRGTARRNRGARSFMTAT